jgi:hypothetical protein
MRYLAETHEPGCLPDTAEPLPRFHTAADAWRYLRDDHGEALDDRAVIRTTDKTYRDLQECVHIGQPGHLYVTDPITGSTRVAEVSIEPETYRIERFYADDRHSEIIVRGLTLAQAQAHCRRDDTRGPGWFDGYNQEED